MPTLVCLGLGYCAQRYVTEFGQRFNRIVGTTRSADEMAALAAKNAHVTGVVPVGLAWNRAIDTGVAGDNPYTGVPAGKINLWAWDSYHASAYGYYLEALLVFAKVTGKVQFQKKGAEQRLYVSVLPEKV